MIFYASMMLIAAGFVALLAFLERVGFAAPPPNTMLVNRAPFLEHPPYTVTVCVLRSHRLGWRRWLVMRIADVRCGMCAGKKPRADDPSHLWEGKRVDVLMWRWRDAWRPLTSEQAMRRLYSAQETA